MGSGPGNDYTNNNTANNPNNNNTRGNDKRLKKNEHESEKRLLTAINSLWTWLFCRM